MKFVHIVVAVTLALGFVAVQSVGSVFANDSNAVAQSNDCGNGTPTPNVFCQNLAAQILGDHDSVAQAQDAAP